MNISDIAHDCRMVDGKTIEEVKVFKWNHMYILFDCLQKTFKIISKEEAHDFINKF